MSAQLPEIVDRYFEADRWRDHHAVVDLFTPDGVVFDEGKQWRGTDGLRAWREGPASTYEYTASVVDWSAVDHDSYLVNVRLDGNFPGGTVDLRFTFTLVDGRITRLRIEP
jgi:hypothetical protein